MGGFHALFFYCFLSLRLGNTLLENWGDLTRESGKGKVAFLAL